MTEDKNYMYADMTKVAELLEEKRTDGEGFALEIRSYKDDIYLYNFLKDKINGTLEKPSIEQYYPHYLIITAHEHKKNSNFQQEIQKIIKPIYNFKAH